MVCSSREFDRLLRLRYLWQMLRAILVSGVVLGLAASMACNKTTDSTGVSPLDSSASDVRALSLGRRHSCLLRANGEVWCWGDNDLGSVGVKGPSPNQQYQPRPTRVANIEPASQLVAAAVSTCIETKSGVVGCWGGNMSDSDAWFTAVPVGDRGRLVERHGVPCVITPSGHVTCWGENVSGRLSPGSDSAVKELWGKKTPPIRLTLPGVVKDVAIGGGHSCALLADRTVSCWGLNNFGQLGNPDAEREQAQPRKVGALEDVVAISSGSFHSCALRKDGTVWCWGRAEDGQLGIGPVAAEKYSDRKSRNQPSKVSGLSNVRFVVAFASRTCAIRSDRTVWCWGENKHGQLGDGTAEDQFEPVKVKPLEKVTALALGHSHSCALSSVGEVFCWGRNYHGSLGNGGLEDSATPVLVWPHQGTGPPTEKAVSKHPGSARDYELLACGLRATVPGTRTWREPSDRVVDEIIIEASDLQFTATCLRRSDMADKDIASLRARSNDAPTETLKIGDVECLGMSADITTPKPIRVIRRSCFTAEYFIDLRVSSPRAAPESAANEVIASLSFFDPRSVIRPATVSADAPAGMVAVPGGDFAMGCINVSLFDKATGALGCNADSMPFHRVLVDAFAIDETEVTWGDYEQCVQDKGCSPPTADEWMEMGKYPQRPVTGVSWGQAHSYCKSQGKRLPTEAEWEKAARGTDGRSKPWGEEKPSCDRAVLDSCPGIRPAEVGGRDAGRSPYGARDMGGNVREWVADYYKKTYYSVSPTKNPKGPESGIHRVIRDTSYQGSYRETYRRMGKPESHTAEDVGFRCARSL